MLHPFPLFEFKHFDASFIEKLGELKITWDEAAEIRLLCNGLDTETTQAKAKELLLRPVQTADSTPNTGRTINQVTPQDTQRSLPSPRVLNGSAVDGAEESKDDHREEQTVLGQTNGRMYNNAARSGLHSPQPPPKVVHYGIERDLQIRLALKIRPPNPPPSDAQAWIDSFAHDMLAETVMRLIRSTANSLGKPFRPALIPFHDGMTATPLLFDSALGEHTSSRGLTWEHARALLDKANFSQWEGDNEGKGKIRTINARFLINGIEDDVDRFRRAMHENLKPYDEKGSVYHFILRNCATPTRAGYLMHSAPIFSVKEHIRHVTRVIRMETDQVVEVAVKFEAAFESKELRDSFYKTYDKKDKIQQQLHNYRKVPTLYCAPRHRNMLGLHLLNAFSRNPYNKYLTTGTEIRFVPEPGSCFIPPSYKMRSFGAYVTDSGKLASITNQADIIDGVMVDTFYEPLSHDPDHPLHTSPFMILSQMPKSPKDSDPAFIQCGRHNKEGGIYGIASSGGRQNTIYYCLLARFYLHAKMVEMGAESLLQRVFTPTALEEIAHFEFDMTTMVPIYKKTEPPKEGEVAAEDGPRGLKEVPSPFTGVTMSGTSEQIEIGSMASNKARQTARKTAKKGTRQEAKDDESGVTARDEETVKSDKKAACRAAIRKFKASNIDADAYIKVVSIFQPNLARALRKCITQDLQKSWHLKPSYIDRVTDALNRAMTELKKNPEGTEIQTADDDQSNMSEVTHFTGVDLTDDEKDADAEESLENDEDKEGTETGTQGAAEETKEIDRHEAGHQGTVDEHKETERQSDDKDPPRELDDQDEEALDREDDDQQREKEKDSDTSSAPRNDADKLNQLSQMAENLKALKPPLPGSDARRQHDGMLEAILASQQELLNQHQKGLSTRDSSQGSQGGNTRESSEGVPKGGTDDPSGTIGDEDAEGDDLSRSTGTGAYTDMGSEAATDMASMQSDQQDFGSAGEE